MKKPTPFVAVVTFGFFLFFPVAGILVFWNDAHGKIRNRAVQYVEKTFVPFYSGLQRDFPNLEASPQFYKNFKDGSFREPAGTPELLSVTPLKSWAREENDKGVQYARLQAEVKFPSTTQSFEIVITRETVENTWRYLEVSKLPR